MNDQTSPDAAGKEFHLHPDVIRLGLVSFLTDLSFEMIFSVFAVFFTTIAGASSTLLGMVEGLASSLSYFAGWMADRTGKRKALTLAGYGFSTLAKIILPITSSVAGPSAFRVIGRLGKGFWGPPHDAWISAMAEKNSRDKRLACTRRSTKREQFLDHSWRTVCLRCLESGSRLTEYCSGLHSFPHYRASWS